MRVFEFILLMLAMLAAGDIAAGNRVALGISLTIVDECRVHVDEPRGPDTVHVECSAGQPHRIDDPLATDWPAASGAQADHRRLVVEF